MSDSAARFTAFPAIGIRAGLGVLCVGMMLATAGAALGQMAPQPQIAPAPGKTSTRAPAKPAAAAQEAPTDNSWLEPLIKLLDSNDLAIRERATGDLQTDTRLSLTALQSRIADRSRPLTPEQSLRLSEVALKLFRETPRAAMGVSFTQRPVPGGVEIGMAIEGFDARRLLKPNDIIAEMDGVPIVSYDDARASIISHDPGDEMAVTFLRNGEVQQGTIRLGSFEDLRNGINLTDPMLREAWMIRCERLAAQGQAGHTAVPVDAGMSPEQWASARAAESRAARKRQQQPPQAMADEYGPQVLVGGGSLRKTDDIPLIDFTDADQRRQSPQARNLQAQIENLQAQVRNFEKQLRDDRNLNELQRANVQRNLRQYRELIQRLKAERVRVLREEAAERR